MRDETVDYVARTRIESHEEICAARYIELQSSLASLRAAILAGGGATIVLLLTALGALIFPRLH